MKTSITLSTNAGTSVHSIEEIRCHSDDVATAVFELMTNPHLTSRYIFSTDADVSIANDLRFADLVDQLRDIPPHLKRQMCELIYKFISTNPETAERFSLVLHQLETT